MSVPIADAMDRLLGGRYWLEGAIGRGGMATVYRARDEVLGRNVALKLFHSDTADPTRQEGELAVLASLNHHALANLFDAGVHTGPDGRAHRFLVMELVTGLDLQQRISGAALTGRQISEIGYDLAEALEYVHGHNVVHRDIKPSNILLVDYGDGSTRSRAKLTDFGIALSEDAERFTAENATTGTAAYLSPEQVSGHPVDGRSDVYSLGLVLLECFTRKVEFPGSAVESAIARLSRDPRMPTTLTAQWQQLLRAMTAREPENRPSDRQLVSSLRQIVIAESARHKDVDAAVIPHNEAARMDAVTRYGILDSPPDGAFDHVTAIAARAFNAPVAIVSIVDHDRIWFKSHHGVDVEQIDREPGLCASAIMQDGPWVISDARVDPRTLTNPLVASDFGLQFYAGVPLRTHDGFNLGTLCVLDFEPREVSEKEMATLADLAAVVMSQIELRIDSARAVHTVTAENLRLLGELSA